MTTKVTVRLSDHEVDVLDRATAQLGQSRTDVVRLAIESYLDDFDDIASAIDRLRDSSDTVHDWDEVKPVLLDSVP